MFFVLGAYTIPPDGARSRYGKGIDWIGAFLSVVGVGLLTFVLSCVLPWADCSSVGIGVR